MQTPGTMHCAVTVFVLPCDEQQVDLAVACIWPQNWEPNSWGGGRCCCCLSWLLLLLRFTGSKPVPSFEMQHNLDALARDSGAALAPALAGSPEGCVNDGAGWC
jgi:hypothetical protein